MTVVVLNGQHLQIMVEVMGKTKTDMRLCDNQLILSVSGVFLDYCNY